MKMNELKPTCSHDGEPIITFGIRKGMETTFMQCPTCHAVLDYYPQYSDVEEGE